MDDLTLKARLAERESIEKGIVRNAWNRANPFSEENQAVSDARQVKASEQALSKPAGRAQTGTMFRNWQERRQAGKDTRQAHRLAATLNRQADRAVYGSPAAQGMNAQDPKNTGNVAETARSNEQLVADYGTPNVPATMVDDGTGAPAPAAPPTPDAQAQQPAGGNVTAVPGAEGGGAAGGAAAQPQGQQMEGMNMGNFLQAAQMFGDQNFRNQQLQMQRQTLRQQNPAYQARVRDAERRAHKKGGLLNAMTAGAWNAMTRAKGRRDMDRLDQSMKFASSERADLEDLLLTKSAVRERDGTDRLRGIV